MTIVPSGIPPICQGELLEEDQREYFREERQFWPALPSIPNDFFMLPEAYRARDNQFSK